MLKSLSGESHDRNIRHAKGSQSRECFFPANVSLAPSSPLPEKADAAIISTALGILGVSPEYSCSINNSLVLVPAVHC